MAKHNKPKKTIFFLEGAAATQEEIDASMELEPGVQFRNAQMVRDDGAIESFDRVAGAVPARYQAVADAKEGKVCEPPSEPPLVEGEAGAAPKVVVAPKPGTTSGWKPNT